MPHSSPYIEDIIGRKPNWLIRFGIGGLLLILLSLLFTAWFVKYPDVIKAEVYISTPNPPIDLVSPINAQIDSIFYYNRKEIIAKGSPLILLKSTAEFSKIEQLKFFLNQLSHDSIFEQNIKFKSISELGELQPNSNKLVSLIEEFNEHFNHKPFEKRINYLKKIILNNEKSYHSIKKQLNHELNDFELVSKNMRRADILFEKGVISEVNYEEEKQRFIRKEILLEKYRAEIINHNTNSVNQTKQLTELLLQKDHFNHEIRADIQNTIKTLKTQLEHWYNNYLISSPIDGYITIFKEHNVGDFLTAGNYVLTILPPEKQNLFAYGNFSVNMAGKLKKDNKAIIKLHSYPYREYGTVDGLIEEISEIPIKNMYSIKIRLPNQLKTGFEEEIIFKQRLTADAELITQDRSLLSRIFNSFKYLIEKNSSK